MGTHQSKAAAAAEAGSGRREAAVVKSASDDKAVRNGTAAAFRAVDSRNVKQLRKALAAGAGLGNVRRSTGTGSDSTPRTRSMSLLEYAVDKNFLPGVAVMLKVCFLHSHYVQYR